MDLTQALRRFTTARPHLLVVEGPAGAAARLAVERLSRERGWPLADTPADADVLVITGSASALAPFVDRLWDQMPGPRARVELASAGGASAALERARGSLADVAAQRSDVRRTERPTPGVPSERGTGGHDQPPTDDPHAGHDMSGHDQPPTDDPHAGHDMSGHDQPPTDDPHAGHDMSGHEGHDMGGMEMPAGLGMADRAPDRDGFKLDVLHVPWGPVLPWWPEGLVVTTVLQGDVVQQATAELLGDDALRRRGWDVALAHLDPAAAAAVVRLDALVRLLGVAGWHRMRLRCQRVRDAFLVGEETVDLPRVAQQIAGSRALARMTAGILTTRGEDVTARYRRWLTEATTAATTGTLPPSGAEPHALHELSDLLSETEVAGLRLIVASLGLALSGAEERTPTRV